MSPRLQGPGSPPHLASVVLGPHTWALSAPCKEDPHHPEFPDCGTLGPWF